MNFGFILSILSGVTLTIGDIVMKQWITANSKLSFIGGMLIYLIGLLFMVFSFRYQNIAVASVLAVIINIVTLTLATKFLYGEQLSVYKLTGIGIGLVAIFFLEYFDK